MDVARPHNLKQFRDAELVRLLIAGNHGAMTVIFDRYYRRVMSVAIRMLHDVGEAEDVAQIVFAEFYRKAKLFDANKGNLGTWLLQYAYSRAINHKRGLAARHFYEQEPLDKVESDSPAAEGGRMLDLDTREATRLVEEILPALSEKQRFVIERVFFEGLKVSEVAAETGETLGNTRHAYYRGMEKLRRCLSTPEKTPINETVSLKSRLFGRQRTDQSPERLRGEVQIGNARIL
jgi:RNA polymerase sigma-70 factor, ECF subfamily